MTSLYAVSENQKVKIVEYLHWLLKKSSLNANGGLTANFFSFDYHGREEVIASILANYIPLDKGIIEKLIGDLVHRLKKAGNNKPDWNDILEGVRLATDEYTNLPSKKYILLFPFFSKEKLNKKFLVVGQTNFKLTTWKTVSKLSGWQEFLNFAILAKRKEQIEVELFTRFIPLIVEVDAKDYREAFGKASKNFELLRAITNLVTEFGTTRYTFGSGIEDPMGSCLPPPIYGIFTQDGQYEQIYYTTENYRYAFVKGPSIGFVEHVSNLLTTIHKLNKDIQNILIAALIRYGQAMDTTEWQISFLAFWQVMEILSLRTSAKSGIKMSDVSNRIGNLIVAKAFAQDILDIFADSRNLLVHDGKFSEDGYRQANNIKVLSEYAIDAFIGRAKQFSTISQLELFYEFISKNDHELKARHKVAKTILSSRNKKRKKRI